jgi:hypothetical protein
MYSTLKLNLKQMGSLTRNAKINSIVNPMNIRIKASKKMFSEMGKYDPALKTKDNKSNSNGNSVNELENLLKR